MANKRLRNGRWAYTIRRSGLLPKPIHLTFEDEAEGDQYVARLEKLLDNGYVPEEFKSGRYTLKKIADCIDAYIERVHVPESDQSVLKVVRERVGSTDMDKADYAWAETWVAGMKAANLSPSTIRHHVGALARCFDWVVRRGDTMMVNNPLRMLPKRYATGHKEEKERDARLSAELEVEVMRILDGGKPQGRERKLELKEQDALKLLYLTGLESGMRMKEIYTLEKPQIDLVARTIFIDRTKNGDTRQVPMTKKLVAAWREYLEKYPDLKVFPWPGTAKQITEKLSSQFSRIFDAAGCPEFTFHGLRHEATCRLYEKTTLSDVQIAKILGWRSLRMAMRYANLRGSDLADRLW